MAKQRTKVDVESELVKLTGLKRKSGESHDDWGKRLLTEAYKIPEDDFDVTEDTFDWCEAALAAKKAKQKLPPFDADAEPADDEEEADDEKPNKSKRDKDAPDDPDEEDDGDDSEDGDDSDDDDDDEAEDDDDDEEEAPKDTKPSKGKRSRTEEKEEADDEEPEDGDDEDDEQEEDKPARGKGKKADKEKTEEAPKKSTKEKPAKASREVEPTPPKKKVESKRERTPTMHDKFHRLVLENLGMSRDELFKLADKQGIELRQTSMGTVLYHTTHTLRLLEELYGIKIPTSKKSTTKPAKGEDKKPRRSRSED